MVQDVHKAERSARHTCVLRIDDGPEMIDSKVAPKLVSGTKVVRCWERTLPWQFTQYDCGVVRITTMYSPGIAIEHTDPNTDALGAIQDGPYSARGSGIIDAKTR